MRLFRAFFLPAAYPPTRRRHAEMLFFSLLALIAAPLLEVFPEERVGLRGHSNLLIPGTCLSREWFGARCPGCGLTRSFVHLAHGDWLASLQVHRIGWVLMAAAAFQVPYRILILRGGDRWLLPKWVCHWTSFVLIALLIGNWMLGQIFNWD